ncbi:MAG TPA: tetratricopeptide repeat protein, partial [Nitrospira sp.]|nr:tetratricopeptide repeat protein [Nitrospira sp.]
MSRLKRNSIKEILLFRKKLHEPGWPAGGELPAGVPERSWTQWEFWLAWSEQPWSPPRREKVDVFFPSDLNERVEKARGAAAGNAARLRALDLQKVHIESVKKLGKHYESFKDTDDLIKKCLTLDLPAIERTKPSNLPYGTLGVLFKCRDTKLEELHRQLTAKAAQSTGSSIKIAIHGLGGVGKTRFAIEYALSHEKDYSGTLFVTADAPGSFRRNLAALCKPLVLNLPEQDAKEEETQLNAVLRWLQAHEGWLLILDNVDTPDAAEEVEQLVGTIKGGSILITSRVSDWSGEVASFELDELAEPAAADFLLVRTTDRRQHLATDEVDALTLAHELGGLAQALEQAGAFIAQKRSSMQVYLQRWRERDRVVREWNDPRLTKYPRAVVSTWDATVQQLSPEGRLLLQQLSWLAPEPVPRFALPDGPVQDALAELASFSLVKFEAEGVRFRVHRLVQEVTRERQTAEEQDASLRSILTILDHAMVGDPQDVRSWLVLDPLRPHLAAAAAHADRHGIVEPTSQLMNQLGLLLLTKASHKEAEPLMRRALAIDEASYGPEHPRVAGVLNNLTLLLQAMNRLVEAEPLMRRRWRLMKRA